MPFAAPPQVEFAYHADGRQKFKGWRRVYRLTRDFTWHDPRQYVRSITIPAGTESDLATIPVWPIAIGGAILLAAAQASVTQAFGDAVAVPVTFFLGLLIAFLVGYLRHDGPWAPASLIHDFLYTTQLATRAQADLAMYEISRETGVGWPVGNVIWRTLRMFGWINYGTTKPSTTEVAAEVERKSESMPPDEPPAEDETE
jgi:hypothetical protein